MEGETTCPATAKLVERLYTKIERLKGQLCDEKDRVNSLLALSGQPPSTPQKGIDRKWQTAQKRRAVEGLPPMSFDEDGLQLPEDLVKRE